MRKISRRSFLKAATVACALTALTACGGGDESAAASVAKDENGAYVDTLTITLGRFAEPSAAALFPEGQTFEDNAYTRYIESKLNVDLVDSFEAGGDAYTNQLATCVASGELPDILTVNSYDTFVEMVNNGLTYDLTDVYEEYASDYIKSLYDSYDGRCLGMATFDGRLMGIPGTNPDNSVPVLCWMRKDWLDKLGINPDPDGDLCITLDDIAAVAKAFVDANVSGGNHTVGMAFSGNDIADAMCIANAMGGYIDRWIENPDGTMSWSTPGARSQSCLGQDERVVRGGHPGSPVRHPHHRGHQRHDDQQRAGHRLWRMAYPRLASEQRQGPGAGGRVHRLYGGR